MKKLWNIVQYFVVFVSIIGIVICIYKRELYLMFKGILCLLLWISMILENKISDKNKIIKKFSWGAIIVLISLSILETFGI